MKPTATLVLALFFASVQGQASLPTPSLSGISSMGPLTSSAFAPTSSSPSSQLPACVLNCAESSLLFSGSNCTSIQDLCICTDTKFQDAMNECLKDCTPAEQLAATGFEKGLCAAVYNTSSSAGSPSHSGNGALAIHIEFTQSGIFVLTVTVAGVVMGGWLI